MMKVQASPVIFLDPLTSVLSFFQNIGSRLGSISPGTLGTVLDTIFMNA
jgi:hypothetical protein